MNTSKKQSNEVHTKQKAHDRLKEFLGDEYYTKYMNIRNRISNPLYKDFYKVMSVDIDIVKSFIDTFYMNLDNEHTEGKLTIYDDSNWVVYKVTNYKAAKSLGDDTKWCISGRYQGKEQDGLDYFYSYISEHKLDGGFYFYINKSDIKKKYCVLKRRSGKQDSIWNASDYTVDVEELPNNFPSIQNVLDVNTLRNKKFLFSSNIEDVTKAITLGVDINAQNKYGETALILSSTCGNVSIVNLLLHYNANINESDSYRETALFRASSNGHLEIVNTLLQSGASINTKNEFGYTPLIIASKNGHVDIVKILLEHGADTHIIDVDGLSALSHAIEQKHTEIAALLA